MRDAETAETLLVTTGPGLCFGVHTIWPVLHGQLDFPVSGLGGLKPAFNLTFLPFRFEFRPQCSRQPLP
jgi:hypothetical protein